MDASKIFSDSTLIRERCPATVRMINTDALHYALQEDEPVVENVDIRAISNPEPTGKYYLVISPNSSIFTFP